MNTNTDVLKKTLAYVTIGHPGATHWIDDAAKNEYKPTGEYEWGVAYTPLPAERSVFLKAAGEGAGFRKAGICSRN